MRTHDFPGEIHAFTVGQFAVGEGFTDDVVAVDLLDEKFHEPVVDEDMVAGRDVSRQPFKIHGDALLIADDVFAVEGKGRARLERDLALGKRFDSELRPFRIEQDRDGNLQTLANFLDDIDTSLMIFVRSVREIESCDVHAGAAEFFDHFRAFARRSDSADDFGFSHGFNPPFFC